MLGGGLRGGHGGGVNWLKPGALSPLKIIFTVAIIRSNCILRRIGVL